jgi:hypothetical protein
VHADTANLPERPDKVERKQQGVAVPHNLHDDVSAAAICRGFDLLDGVVAQEDGLGADFLGFFEALGDAVDGVDRLAHCQGADDGADADGAAAYYHGDGGLAVLRREVLEKAGRGEVACGEDVGHQDEHLLWDICRGRDEGGISEGHSHVLGLSAIDRVDRDTVPEQFAFAAARGLPTLAVEAVEARGVERDDDLVALLEFGDRVALLRDGANEFVAADEARRALQVAAVIMQV